MMAIVVLSIGPNAEGLPSGSVQGTTTKARTIPFPTNTDATCCMPHATPILALALT